MTGLNQSAVVGHRSEEIKKKKIILDPLIKIYPEPVEWSEDYGRKHYGFCHYQTVIYVQVNVNQS